MVKGTGAAMRRVAEALPAVEAQIQQAQIHAIPRRGYVLAAAAESYGAPIRQAVSILRAGFDRVELSALYRDPSSRSPAELAAWKLTAAWVVSVTLKELSPVATLVDAARWFGDSKLLDAVGQLAQSDVQDAQKILSGAAHGSAVSDLLPYILDPHGQASRLTVRTRPETKIARAQKRADGVFYTPADVANYMAENSLLPLIGNDARVSVFDPACGTGVFLRASLSVYKQREPAADLFKIAKDLLFGTDIDPWAVDATAFVLLHDCLDAVEQRRRTRSPHRMWIRLRENFACFDALLLDPSVLQKADARPAKLSRRRPINVVLPHIGEGPRLIIANPPYANVGSRSDLLELATTFATLAETPKATADVYPLFLEQMIRLAHPGSHGGSLVLPLSIGSNTGRQFVAARKLVSRTAGRWRFAFFDREPHALFGEDVKTRNAILLWDRPEDKLEARIETGPLRKWRGNDRAVMFRTIEYIPFNGDITEGVPKLSSVTHANALSTLLGNQHTLIRFASKMGRAELAHVPSEKSPSVFIGATAYNFINAFRRIDAGKLSSGALSEHPLHAVRFAKEEDAAIGYAILSSCYAYWWWHVNDDGFHVSRTTISDLPVGTAFASRVLAKRLGALGGELWEAVQDTPIRSMNKGRVSYGYNPARFIELRHQIDQLLMKALDLDTQYADELAQFCCRVSSASVEPTAKDRK